MLDSRNRFTHPSVGPGLGVGLLCNLMILIGGHSMPGILRSMLEILQFVPKPRLPICSLCNEGIELETVKTDEHGKAIHDECYLLKMRLKDVTPPKAA